MLYDGMSFLMSTPVISGGLAFTGISIIVQHKNLNHLKLKVDEEMKVNEEIKYVID